MADTRESPIKDDTTIVTIARVSEENEQTAHYVQLCSLIRRMSGHIDYVPDDLQTFTDASSVLPSITPNNLYSHKIPSAFTFLSESGLGNCDLETTKRRTQIAAYQRKLTLNHYRTI